MIKGRPRAARFFLYERLACTILKVKLFTKAKTIFEKHREHWLTVAFLLGFVIDNITLNRVDQLFDNVILATYVILAMLSLLFLYAATAERFPEKMNPFIRKYAPLLTQYAFGGLLSGMLIFYGRSGSWFTSWPFLLIILGVIFGNETIKDRVRRLIFNLAVLFIGIFSYVVLIVPVVTGAMGPWVFIGSGIIALLIMLLFIRILRFFVPRFIEIHLRPLVFAIGTIFAVFNILYFTNAIPPIPLSLKEVGIYHGVVRYENGDYLLTYEKPEWWEFYRDSDSKFHYQFGDNVYCFASVFAPTRLRTDIYHRWERYDEDTKKWVLHGRLTYPISGGRGDGFRGYTQIANYAEGTWRCTIETARGQVLGSEKFTIEGGAQKELVTRIE
jgi:hypothetical protein